MLRRLALGLVVLVSTAVAVPSGAAQAWTPRPATFEVSVTKDVPITVSDGTILSADVYRPAGKDGRPAAGRFPTLVVQTPYNKDQQKVHSDYLVRRGYVDVVVDVRGTGGSGGTFSSFDVPQQQDGKDVVGWAAAQPWSTGRVGLHGASYYGINQLLTAALQPPALKAIFPIVPTGDNYRTTVPGGRLTSLAAFSLLYATNGATPPGYTGSDPVRAAGTVGTRPGNVLGAANYNVTTAAGGDGAYDGPYYRNMSPLWKIDRIKTPTFLVGGWYDALSQRDAPLLFRELQRRNVPVKLVMGPWYHTTPGKGLPAQGVPVLDELQLRWFDRYVRGTADPGLTAFPAVNYHRVGEGRFHSAGTWPVPGIAWTKLALSGGGALTTGTGAGPADSVVAQPLSGACTRSTAIGTFGLAPSTPCETDNSSNDRTGVTYDLPLKAPLDLTGPLSARLFVSTTGADAFVTLRVEDVDPATGAANEITAGWDTLSFRALDPQRTERLGTAGQLPFHPYTKESVQEVKAGAVYDWSVELRPIAARVAAGHVLRLSIQTSDVVRFVPNGPALARTTGSVVSIHHDDQRPSALIVPVTR